MENALLKKLQIKPGYTVKIENATENILAIFGDIPSNIQLDYGAPTSFQALLAFATSKEVLYKLVNENRSKINEKTVFWIIFPKKAAKLSSDLDSMETWKNLDQFGISPCASAAINEVWTALRLKFITAIKASGTCNEDIQKNELARYIDVQKKTVILPDYLAEALSHHPGALDFYQGLAYSHRKEYVLWIVTAKQGKTRIVRIEKMIQMLLSKKKNPTDKN
ncbi:YdeI/OmpD-associated family protein [Pedobacter sp. MW01-1-1]|uniref:YdeI/OmpD-associated family protein n=1 Tax=Pedobacter sp. MW01-1-1 TaxID=3383027 RepID=UPI003FF15379